VLTLLESQKEALESEFMNEESQITPVYNAILRSLHKLQQSHLSLRLLTLRDCCAAANDFEQLSDALEDPQFARDLVHAAEYSTHYLMRQLHPSRLFTDEWLRLCTNNDIVRGVIVTIENHLQETSRYLRSEFLREKTRSHVAHAVTRYYMHHLLERPDPLGVQGLRRTKDDVTLLTEYWESIYGRRRRPCAVLELIVEALTLLMKADTEESDVNMMMIVFHQRTGANVWVTVNVWRDLYRLAGRRAPKNKHELAAELEHVTQLHKEQKIEQRIVSDSNGMWLLQTLYEDRVAIGLCGPCRH